MTETDTIMCTKLYFNNYRRLKHVIVIDFFHLIWTPFYKNPPNPQGVDTHH